MKQLLPLLILINCHMIQVSGVLEWIVIGKVTDYGQEATLFCNVSNCCPKDSGWDRYSPEQRTLFIDVKSGRSNKKYDGKTLRDGYTLVIKNLTKNDLNVSYSCVYGVTIGQSKFLLEEDVFIYISNTTPNVPHGNSRLSGIQIAGIVIGIVGLVTVSVVFFVLYSRRNGNHRKRDEAQHNEEEGLLDMDILMDHDEVIPKHILEQFEKHLEQWKKDDQQFVSTEAEKHVMQKVLTQSSVTLVGNSGIGKSFLSKHIALMMSKHGYTVIPCTKPEDIGKWFKHGQKTLFVFDDVCGRYTLNQQIYTDWKQRLDNIKSLLEDKCCKIISTCRLEVYKDELFSNLSIFKMCNINLSSDEFKLSAAEKNALAEVYFKENTDEVKELSEKYDFPPLLYSLSHKQNLKNVSISSFFSNPFVVFKDQVVQMYGESDAGKIQYCSLVLCVMFNNRLTEENLSPKDKKIGAIIEDLLEECELNKGTSFKRLKKSLETLEGTYVVKEDSTYKIIHEKLFDFLAKYFGEKMIQIFIDHANTGFIRERFLWQITDNMGTEIEFAIRIPDNYIHRYIERLMKDWENGNVNNVFVNRNMKSTLFTENLVTHLNQLDLSKQQELVCTKDIHNKDIALGGSCYMGTIELVKWLISRNSDINYCREDGGFPLLMASQKGHVNVVIELLQHSADVNKCDNNGASPLYKASQNGHVNGVIELLQHSADVHKCDNTDASPLWQASQNGHVDVVKELLQYSADVNKCNNNGASPLHTASANGHVDVVKELLQHSADVNKCENNNESPLSQASQNGHVDVVKELLQHLADVNKCNNNGASPLYTASQNGHVDVVKELLQHSADVHKCDNNEASSLYVSSQNGHVIVVKELLHHSAEVNKCQNNGESSLFIASQNGHVDVVKELLEHSAEVNQCNNEKISPLFTASQYGHVDAVQELLQHSANVNECDDQGRNALQVAQEHGHFEVESLLLGKSENFDKLLSTGTYESFENRVFLCGSCACGKSTLASVLIGSPIPLTWKSTDGLVIHFGRNGINLETHDMVPLKEEGNGQNILTKVVIGKPNRDTSTHQSFDTYQHQINVQSSTVTDNMESNVQVEQTDTDNDKSAKVFESSDACVREFQEIPVTHIITSETKKAPSRSLPQVKKIELYAVRDDILTEVRSGKYKVKIAPSDLVDFGGQRSYDMTHQLFVQHGGTFVVMFDGSRDFHKPLQEYPTGDVSNESIVKHWVNSILTYCVDDEDIMPMILFAATHSDMLSEDMQKKLKTEFVKKITDIFGTHEMKKHIVFDPIFFINGTDKDNHEIKMLKNQLVSIARKQPTWGVRRPMKWVPLELQITNMKKDNINIIHKTHVTEANNMNGDLALSDTELDAFLLTQHALGKIMYFNQPGIDNFIIIYPPALVNILRSFITDEIFWPEEETLRNILESMTDKGTIYKEDLLKLWQQPKFYNDMPDDDFKEFIIQVLVHLDVLVQPKRYSGKSDAHVDYYLVPCIVKNKMPMSFLDEKSFSDRTLSLVYRLQKSSIPSALSFKLIGAVSGIWPIKELYGRPLLYHSSAVVCVDGKTEFRIIVEDTKVVVFLTHITSKSSISPDIAASIQECLTRTLEIVLKFYLTNIGKSHQNVNVSDLFQIEVGEVCCRSACTVTVSAAKLKSSWICNNANSHSSIYSLLWVFNKTQEECLSDCPGLPNSILTNSPSELELARFADQLTNNTCKKLMVYLGLQSKDWEDIEDCYTGNGVRIMALHSWKIKRIQGKPTRTFGNLQEALKEVDDRRHLLCKVFREDTDLLDEADVRLQCIPDDDVLENLPQNIGNCAIQLGIELGVSMSSITDTMVRHHKNMYRQIEEILKKWKSSIIVTPTIYRLMLALERVDTGGLDYLKKRYLEK